ncbi:MAG: ATP-binding protein [Deltaproteobacteria bacterium]|nr:ATP-binding protein [Deltaproteobacteria bacterium]
MSRHFNTAGPCKPELHFMLPPDRRLPGVRELIDQQGYFVLHAPRQVGKTTALLSLGAALTAEGRYAALLVSMETGAAFPDDVGAAEHAILAEWRRSARHQLPADLQPPPWPDTLPGSRIGAALEAWSASSARPLVVFLDEIDALRDNVLLSVLRQLRAGHRSRPAGFPWALGLVGLRDVRDYKVASGGSEHLHTASPFNIKVRSLTMREFTADEVAELYAQHTTDTGQRFDDEALRQAFAHTQGQPWLVNALAYVVTTELKPDRATSIAMADIDRARDVLVDRQDTHLDSLAERLRDPRVRAVIEPMIQGESLAALAPDDLRFVLDLGLVRERADGGVEVANPIYREIIARQLTVTMRASLPAMVPTWLAADGRIDFDRLLEAFVAFWVQHGEAMLASSPYNEAAPHLVMMAFLHRVVNGGGRIDREYAIGSKRLDLCVAHRSERLGIEVKTWRDADKAKDPTIDGLTQLDGYLARIGVGDGWLVLFDQRKGAPVLPERQAVETVTTAGGRRVKVVRL